MSRDHLPTLGPLQNSVYSINIHSFSILTYKQSCLTSQECLWTNETKIWRKIKTSRYCFIYLYVEYMWSPRCEYHMRVYSLNLSALHQKRKTKFMSIDMPQCNWFVAYEIDCIKQQFNKTTGKIFSRMNVLQFNISTPNLPQNPFPLPLQISIHIV